MRKTILITGATDGIGLATARLLAAEGHDLLVHGRNPRKLEVAASELSALEGGGRVESLQADLSKLDEVVALTREVADRHDSLHVLINNAGVYRVPEAITADGLDVRFVVNTIAPYILTKRLLPLLGTSGRVVNLSSAAQAPVDVKALLGESRLDDGEAYAQSKLALTMWSRSLARSLEGQGPVVVAVNPGSLLGTKMVKQAYGMTGGDVGIGADVLRRAALEEEFAGASGQYFDNDSGCFASPHPDALDSKKVDEVLRAIEGALTRATG